MANILINGAAEAAAAVTGPKYYFRMRLILVLLYTLKING